MRRTRWADRCGGRSARHIGRARGGARRRQARLTSPTRASCPIEIGLNSVWVLVAGILVMFMQAGFAFLEIGFSRGKNAGTVVAKILVNFSICRALLLGGRLRLRVRRRQPDHRYITASSWPARTSARTSRSINARGRHGHRRDALVLPVRLLRGLARDRLGHDARAHQVRRLRDLRGRLLGAHLPDRRPLDLRWRLARHAVRRAGLRRLDGGAPDGRDRRVRGAAAARPASRQVRRRRQAAGHPGPQHAALRPRHPDPVARLVRLQPGLGPATRSTAASPRSRWSPTSRPPRA